MTHEITNYEKKHYLIKCSKCSLHWRREKKFIRLKKKKVDPGYIGMQHGQLIFAQDTCPGCLTDDNLESPVSQWKLWQKEKPLFRPYDIEIQCHFGSIASIRFNLVKAIKAQGTSAPYLIATRTYPILVHGDFSTYSLWKLNLRYDCNLEEGKYIIKPFHIIVKHANIILYKLDNIVIKGSNPFVQLNPETSLGTLAPNSEFSANLSYLDPIWTKT